MSFLKSITSFFSDGTANVINAVGDAFDKNITTDEERAAIEAKIIDTMADLQTKVTEAALVEQQEITKRAVSDNQSESWLPRNIRPLTLAYLTIITSAYAGATTIWTPENLEVVELWVGLLTTVLLLVYGFYFGSRGLEKIADKISTTLSRKSNV